MSLQDAVAKAKAELESLKAQEQAALARSGLRDTVNLLTQENQALTERRSEARERLDEVKKAITAARDFGALLELQIKGARSRVEKLRSAVGPGARR